MAISPASILLVEPNPVERDLIRLALTRLDVEVDYAGSGADALAYFSERRPDLMLLDLFLPQQNGLELLQQLKTGGALTGTDVVVISALGFPEIVQQAVKAGVRDFLVKPIDTDLLVERVKRIL